MIIKAGWLINPNKKPVKNPVIEVENGIITRCHPEQSPCHPERSEGSTSDSSVTSFPQNDRNVCHPEKTFSNHERATCHPKQTLCHPEKSPCNHEQSHCHPERSEGSQSNSIDDSFLMKDKKIIDLGDSIILPGFINSHCHFDYSFLKNQTPAGNFIKWLKYIIRMKNKPGENWKNDSDKSVVSAVKDGMTAFGDVYTKGFGLESLSDIGGLKGTIFIEFIDPEGLMSEKAIKEKIAFIENKIENTGFKVGIMAHSVYSVAPVTIKKLRRLALEKNLLFAIHISESPEEVALVKYGNGPLVKIVKETGYFGQGLSPLRYLKKLGCIEKTVLVHAVNFEDDDFDIIEKYKNDIILCPLSNRFLKTGVADYHSLKSVAGRISLATDSLASNKSIDLISEARAAVEDYGIDYNECLSMITFYPGLMLDINAYIKEGKPADLVAFKPCKVIESDADLLKEVFEGSKCVFSMVNGIEISSSSKQLPLK